MIDHLINEYNKNIQEFRDVRYYVSYRKQIKKEIIDFLCSLEYKKFKNYFFQRIEGYDVKITNLGNGTRLFQNKYTISINSIIIRKSIPDSIKYEIGLKMEEYKMLMEKINK